MYEDFCKDKKSDFNLQISPKQRGGIRHSFKNRQALRSVRIQSSKADFRKKTQTRIRSTKSLVRALEQET